MTNLIERKQKWRFLKRIDTDIKSYSLNLNLSGENRSSSELGTLVYTAGSDISKRALVTRSNFLVYEENKLVINLLAKNISSVESYREDQGYFLIVGNVKIMGQERR